MNTNTFRIVQIIIGLLFLSIMVNFTIPQIFNSNINIDGFLILYCVFALLFYLYFKLTVFDWDIYIVNGKIQIKRFNQITEIKKIENLKVYHLGVVTKATYIYILKVNNRKFFVKLNPIKYLFFDNLSLICENHTNHLKDLLSNVSSDL